MASLAESYPTLLAALADHYGQPQFAPEGRSAFEAVLAAALARPANPARAEAALEALDHSGLLEPMTLAGIEPSEILDSLRDTGLSLPARSATLLVRLPAGTRRPSVTRTWPTIRRPGSCPDAAKSWPPSMASGWPRPTQFCWRWASPFIRWTGVPIASSSATAGSIRPRNTTRRANC